MIKLHLKRVMIILVLAFSLPGIVYAACKPSDFNRGFGLSQSDPAKCKVSGNFEHLITGSICLAHTFFAQSMFYVYCGFVEYWKPNFARMMQIYISLYFIAVLFGISNTSLKDAAVRVVKVSLIYAFGTQPMFFYEWLYKLALGMIDEFSVISLSIVQGAQALNPKDGVLGQYDLIFSGVVGSDKLYGIVALMGSLLIHPELILLAMMLFFGLITLLLSFAQIMIAYSTTLIALAFTMMFAPLFFSFMLFPNITGGLAKQWVASIVSYIGNIILMLMFLLVMSQAMDVSNLNRAFNNLVEPHDFVFKDFFLGADRTFHGYKLKKEINIKDQYDDVTGFIITWAILNIVVISFLRTLPNMARELMEFDGRRAGIALTGRSQTIQQVMSGSNPFGQREGAFTLGGVAGAVTGAISEFPAFKKIIGTESPLASLLGRSGTDVTEQLRPFAAFGIGALMTGREQKRGAFRRRGGVPQDQPSVVTPESLKQMQQQLDRFNLEKLGKSAQDQDNKVLQSLLPGAYSPSQQTTAPGQQTSTTTSSNISSNDKAKARSLIKEVEQRFERRIRESKFNAETRTRLISDIQGALPNLEGDERAAAERLIARIAATTLQT